jgi:hypothetical protein
VADYRVLVTGSRSFTAAAVVDEALVSTYEDDWQGIKWMRTDVLYRHERDSRTWASDRHADRLVAVRRYTEG